MILAEVMVVTLRDIAISKIQHLPESLIQQIIDFIDVITRHHHRKTVIDALGGDRSQDWAQWFRATDDLEITPTAPTSEYQQRLLSKYRQQGLDL